MLHTDYCIRTVAYICFNCPQCLCRLLQTDDAKVCNSSCILRHIQFLQTVGTILLCAVPYTIWFTLMTYGMSPNAYVIQYRTSSERFFSSRFMCSLYVNVMFSWYSAVCCVNDSYLLDSFDLSHQLTYSRYCVLCR